MKIAICGLIKSENLGEELIAKSLAWIIKDVANEKIEIVETDIMAKDSIVSDKRVFELPFWAIDGFIRRISSQRIRNFFYYIKHILWQCSPNYGIKYKKYFCEKFKDVDLIVIDGAGLLEYSYNEYQEPLNLISKYADKNRIPVVFNAIGRAGEFDEKDYRCKVLKKAFSYDCVKYVSARDSVESVRECVGDKFEVKLLADAAFWANKAYETRKDSNSNTIGIGLIRANAMQSYSKGITEEQFIQLFADIAKELQRRNYKFQFFTNGMKIDYEVGKRVLEKMGLDESYLVKRPERGMELMETISGYSGLITCRMHSSIAGFSMGIPSVALSWNDKVDKYMKIVGYPQRAIKQDECNSKTIVDRLEIALKEGISEENSTRMKQLARQSVEEWIVSISN